MHPIVWGILLVIYIVIVVIYSCREMKEDWQEKKPPRFRDYFWKVIETIAEFFD